MAHFTFAVALCLAALALQGSSAARLRGWTKQQDLEDSAASFEGLPHLGDLSALSRRELMGFGHPRRLQASEFAAPVYGSYPPPSPVYGSYPPPSPVYGSYPPPPAYGAAPPTYASPSPSPANGDASAPPVVPLPLPSPPPVRPPLYGPPIYFTVDPPPLPQITCRGPDLFIQAPVIGEPLKLPTVSTHDAAYKAGLCQALCADDAACKAFYYTPDGHCTLLSEQGPFTGGKAVVKACYLDWPAGRPEDRRRR